jgi:hypothetical protein
MSFSKSYFVQELDVLQMTFQNEATNAKIH